MYKQYEWLDSVYLCTSSRSGWIGCLCVPAYNDDELTALMIP